MTHFKEIDRHIGMKIKELRTLEGLSQAELGKLLHVTFQQIQKYERGKDRISASSIYIIAKSYGKPLNWFFDTPIIEVKKIDMLLNKYLARIKDESVKIQVISLVKTLGDV